jgi:hypothetical protein
MGGGNQAHVDLMRPAASQAFELLFLQNAQKFRLQGQRQVPDFVEEDSAGISHFEAADFLSHGPGKGTLLMPEQFTLQQIERKRPPLTVWTSV